MDINSSKSWQVLNLSSQVQELCTPIRKHFDVTYFNYVRLNQNHTRYLLSDRPEWISTFYTNKYYNQRTTVDIEALKYKGYLSWRQFKEEFTFQEAALKFNIANGITIIEPSEKCLDLYYFGTTSNNISASERYESNIDAFKRFILYFKDRGAKILTESHSMPILLEDGGTHKSKYNFDSFEQFITTIINSDEFRFVYGKEGNPKFLSKQETICASYTILQFSMFEIAEKLGISHRTVETYMNNIKIKLSCESKHKLINKLLNLKIANISNIDNQIFFYPYNVNNLMTLNDFIAETNIKRLYLDHSYSRFFYLTPRECELLYYICNGLSPKIIAIKTNCSLKTTENYINNLKEKFFLKKKSDLVAFCVSSGLLHKIAISFPNFASR